jgi:hypothetical protein
MPLQQHPNVDAAVRYHQAVSDFATGEELAAFFHPDATFHEMPNALFPDGNVANLARICAAAEAGRARLSTQSFEVVNALAVGDEVALEVRWSGAIATPLGDLPAGIPCGPISRPSSNFAMERS